MKTHEVNKKTKKEIKKIFKAPRMFGWFILLANVTSRVYGNSDNLSWMRRLILCLITLVIFLIPEVPAQATEDIELELKDPTYLGNVSMNILFEIKNNSDKKMDVMTIYSNNEFPARDATVVVGQTYPFVGSLDPYYSDFFKYQVLVRGYLLTEFRYVQGYVKIKNKTFRKTGFTTYTNFFTNVIDLRAYSPN